MKKIILFFSFLIISFQIFTSTSHAQDKSVPQECMNVKNGKCILSTNDTTPYCDPDDNKYKQKFGCRYARQWDKICSNANTPCGPGEEVYICQVKLISNSCTPNFGTGAVDKVIGTVDSPPQVNAIGFGAAGISRFLSNIVNLIYVIAGIAFLFMIVISAFQWIISGGDKEAVASARKRLTYAIMGIVLLSLAFLIIGLIGGITGFTLFNGQGRFLK